MNMSLHRRVANVSALYKDVLNFLNKRDSDVLIDEIVALLRDVGLFIVAVRRVDGMMSGHLIAGKIAKFLRIKYQHLQLILRNMHANRNVFTFSAVKSREEIIRSLMDDISSIMRCVEFNEYAACEINGRSRMIDLRMKEERCCASFMHLFDIHFIKDRAAACVNFIELCIGNGDIIADRLDHLRDELAKIDNGCHIEQMDIVHCTAYNMISEVRFLSDAHRSVEEEFAQKVSELFANEDAEYVRNSRGGVGGMIYAGPTLPSGKKESEKKIFKLLNMLSALAFSRGVPVQLICSRHGNAIGALHQFSLCRQARSTARVSSLIASIANSDDFYAKL